MIATAIKAKLPLIAIRTNDPMNVAAALEHYTTMPVTRGVGLSIKNGVPLIPAASVVVIMSNWETPAMDKLFSAAVAAGSVLVFVNPEEVHPMMFDAGVVHMPDIMLKNFVESYAPEDSDHYELEAALRGLSFKEMVEVSKLAMAESGAFTAEAVLKIRRARTVLSSGLKLVDTKQFFYAPPHELGQWLAVDGKLFTANVDRIVRPRGLLFSGAPGTGKTSGAKHIAHQLRLPLYLLDVGGTLQKYVGDSEKNFQAALAQVETLAPCVLLMDEIEKVFDTSDESGVSRRVLGMLLWWLQEHPAQVLTIMTTNDVGGIPAELIRPGRIDREIEFKGLIGSEAVLFATEVADNLTKLGVEVDDAAISEGTYNLCKSGSGFSATTQAKLTQMVVDLVKVRLAAKLQKE